MAIKSLQHSSLTDNIFYRSMLAGNTAYDPSDEDILAEEVLTSSQASVTFSSLDTLAAGYQHLQIRYVAGNTNVATDFDNVIMRFNSDAGANYAHHRLWGTGSVNSYASSSQTQMLGGLVSRGSSTAFAANVIDILDAFETTKNKTIRVLTGGTNSSQNVIGLNSGLWISTSAVTTILLSNFENTFRVGSRFTLIGLK